MSTELKDRPAHSDSDGGEDNVGQQHADEMFNQLTSDSHMKKDGKSGDLGGDKKDSKTNPADSMASAGAAAQNFAKNFGTSAATAGAGSSLTALNKAKNYFWGSKTRRNTTIGGGVGGIIATIVIAMTTLILPLKIEGLVNNLEARFGAASQKAAQKTTATLFDRWVQKHIMPNIGTPRCKTLVDAGCVSKASGVNPISQLYNSWREGKLERKMAERYGFQLTKNGNVWHLKLDGKDYNIGNGSSIYGDNAHSGNRREIRAALNKHLDTLTLREKISYRFIIAPHVRAKYGIRHCWNVCKYTDKVYEFTDTHKVKTKAAFAQTTHRIIEPISANYALIFQCVLTTCDPDLVDATKGDLDRTSEIGHDVRTNLLKFAASFGSEALEDVVKAADKIAKEGFAKYFGRLVIEKVFTKVIGESAGKIAGAVGSEFIPYIGVIIFLVRVVVQAEVIGPAVRQIIYFTLSSAAVTQFTEYQTVRDEIRAGQMDSTQLGGYVNAISTNVNPYQPGDPEYDPEVANNISDMTQTPVYNALFSNQTTSINDRPKIDKSNPQYVCPEDDNKPVPTGQAVCGSEVFARGVGVFDFVTDVYEFGDNPISKSARGLGRAIFDAIDSAISWALGPLIDILVFGCKTSPVCQPGVDYIKNQLGEFGKWLLDTFVGSPFSTNMSGGRTGDMVIGGADAYFNTDVCQNLYGCQRVSDKEAYAIQNQALNQAKHDFAQRPFFARMFSTDTPYSMLSRVAIQMPGSLSMSIRSISDTLIKSPFAVISQGFASILNPQPAFAGAGAITKDPYGVPQTAFPDDKIPDANHIESYWDDNCADKYDESTGELDISDWLNAQEQDKDSGLAVPGKEAGANRCLLILRTAQSGGGLFDKSMLPPPPQISVNDGTATTPTSNGSLPTGTAQDLAKQLMVYVNQGKITCPFEVNCRDIRFTAQGTSIKNLSCYVDALNPKLLGMLLKLAQMGHTFSLTALCSDHPSNPSSLHHKGRAADFNTIDGTFMGPNDTYWTGARLTAGKNLDRDIVSFMPKTSAQFGQVQCHPTFDFFSGYVTYPDSCHHQHVQVVD